MLNAYFSLTTQRINFVHVDVMAGWGAFIAVQVDRGAAHYQVLRRLGEQFIINIRVNLIVVLV